MSDKYVSYCPACRCRHGWIICTDGTKSEQFVTISKGMKVLAKLIYDGKVSRGAEEEYMRTIAMSEFAFKDDELDEAFSAMLKEKEELLNHAYDSRSKEPDIVTRIEETMARPPEKKVLH